ncbi:HDIG domain-containing metalloprotein [Methanococcus aeolicus]|uniref:Metal dependent phosphohydrolase n=1 Tax=Methanococcus aeolicus (strain ATCC BAA-1280 / DSM 17508 / OCM 812 / Nankai-3) TaxID=419665 RepID=A6UVJ1_META3|nr:metal dependent phosphohydrolase [Methanococcus aeolicus Nankai-3]
MEQSPTRKLYNMDDLFNLVEKIEDKDLKNIVIDFINNPLPSHKDVEDTNIPFEQSPASIRWHHKYEGGLIEHTMAITDLALNMAKSLENSYNLQLNKDLIIAGGILHDIMKPQNYIIKDNKNNGNNNNQYDHISEFHLEHLTLMVAEMYKRNVPMELIKIVASHHGEYGAMKPDSIESWLLHYADSIDASLNDVAIKICNARARDMGIQEQDIYEAFTPLKIYELRSTVGKEKLKEYLNGVFINECEED